MQVAPEPKDKLGIMTTSVLAVASAATAAAGVVNGPGDPCRGYQQNKVWLELALAAADLLTWMQALCLNGELARCEPAALRYRLLHVAARLVHTGRRWHLKIDKDWPWATHLATAFTRLRAAPWPA